MLSIPTSLKPSTQHLKEVFTVRKKTGPYSKISLETKLKLISEFGKVFLFFFYEIVMISF